MPGGWGEFKTPPDCNGTSMKMVLRSEMERKARELADAVEAYFEGPQTTGKAEAMQHALFSYRVTEAAINTNGHRELENT